LALATEFLSPLLSRVLEAGVAVLCGVQGEGSSLQGGSEAKSWSWLGPLLFLLLFKKVLQGLSLFRAPSIELSAS